MAAKPAKAFDVVVTKPTATQNKPKDATPEEILASLPVMDIAIHKHKQAMTSPNTSGQEAPSVHSISEEAKQVSNIAQPLSPLGDDTESHDEPKNDTEPLADNDSEVVKQGDADEADKDIAVPQDDKEENKVENANTEADVAEQSESEPSHPADTKPSLESSVLTQPSFDSTNDATDSVTIQKTELTNTMQSPAIYDTKEYIVPIKNSVHSHSHVGVIVAGIISGLVVLALVVAVAFMIV